MNEGTSRRRFLGALLTGTGACLLGKPAWATPPRQPTIALQVLGSGGPIAEGIGASTSYLVRIDGTPRLLVDAGSGAFLRFGQAHATVADLQGIALTHLHADHTVDLPGLLMSGWFEDGRAPLPVIGPAGGGRFPGTKAFLASLLSRDAGAWGYLSGYLDGSEGLPKLEVTEVAASTQDSPTVTTTLGQGIRLTALPVNHGAVPALGYLVEAGGKAIVFAGDQSARSVSFEERLAGRRPDLLVAHHVIPEDPDQPRNLHRPPSSIGELAAKLQAGRLVLGHNMRRSLDRLDDDLNAIRTHYHGPVDVAHDLQTFAV